VLPLSQRTFSWPWRGVVAGDGSLVAGLEPGVRVRGVVEGDAVAALVAGLVAHGGALFLGGGGRVVILVLIGFGRGSLARGFPRPREAFGSGG
jgi:hypothetical protein